MDQALLCRVGTRAERRWDLLEQVTTTIRDRIRDLTHETSARVSITGLLHEHDPGQYWQCGAEQVNGVIADLNLV